MRKNIITALEWLGVKGVRETMTTNEVYTRERVGAQKRTPYSIVILIIFMCPCVLLREGIIRQRRRRWRRVVDNGWVGGWRDKKKNIYKNP
jgi:hypothetical protein